MVTRVSAAVEAVGADVAVACAGLVLVGTGLEVAVAPIWGVGGVALKAVMVPRIWG
jgi:hypothetical protein